MPCYRCGARQVDPVRGASPWKRGVQADQQVLVCPDCQAVHDWMSDMDRCRACGSVHLVRRLGEVECRDCGFTAAPDEQETPGAGPEAAERRWSPGAADAPPGEAGRLPGLSEEVASALDRVLGRTGPRASVPARSG